MGEKQLGMGVGKLMEMKTTKLGIIREFVVVILFVVLLLFAEDSLGFGLLR